jgi:cytochrome b subunit of formate dehydrogenase
MQITSPKTIQIPGNNGHGEEAAVIERIKHKARLRRLRAAQILVARMHVSLDGTRSFLRFNRLERTEHQLLIATFATLAVTGLLQRYSRQFLVAWVINSIFGGVETLRTVHHLSAAIFILETICHLGKIIYIWFVKREQGAMWPRLRDLTDLFAMVKFNANRVKKKPAFDRFSIEEKVEYWALLWGTGVMVLTGLIQWFPTLITEVLPGDVIPISRVVHSWEAVLATLSILTWHIYHTVIKERNQSIFTGFMTEKEMVDLHPLEYQRIMAADEYLRKTTGEEHPVLIPDGIKEKQREMVETGQAN